MRDLFDIVILYISNSHRNIILNRAYIFNINFKNTIHLIYKIPYLKKLYSKFFVLYWGLTEIQQNRSLILKVFLEYQPFRKDILRISLFNDDVELFDQCYIESYDIHSKINKFSAWNIFLYSKYKILPLNNWVLFDLNKLKTSNVLEIFKTRFFISAVSSTDIYKLYNYNINRKYIPCLFTDYTYNHPIFGTLQQIGVAGSDTSKKKFYDSTRNILKFILHHTGKFDNLEIHKFLIAQNNLSLIYEYFTHPSFLNNTLSGKNTNFANYVLETLKLKILKDKNILSTLFQNRYLIVMLYESDPKLMFKYFVKNYKKLSEVHVEFIITDLFSKTHQQKYYSSISEKIRNISSSKTHKCYRKSVKKNRSVGPPTF